MEVLVEYIGKGLMIIILGVSVLALIFLIGNAIAIRKDRKGEKGA